MHKIYHTTTSLIAFVLIAALLTACAKSRDSVQDVQGVSHRLEQPGQWIFINYWAFWCKPCRKEVPELNAFAAANQQTVQLWAVNFDGVQGEQLIKEAEQLGFQFPVLTEDPGFYWQVEKPKVLPTTVVIQPDGQLHSLLYGPQSVETLNRLISNASNRGAQDNTINHPAPSKE